MQRLAIFEIFLRKKLWTKIDEKPCFSLEKPPHFTGFELTREHHCDGLLFCTSTLAAIKCELRVEFNTGFWVHLKKVYKNHSDQNNGSRFIFFV